MGTIYTFQYSQEFIDMIVGLHRGKENLPFYQTYIADHLGGSGSRLSDFMGYLSPEIAYHCGDLASKRVLDFGCGTGATTVVLAMASKDVTAFDIDEKSVAICKRRLKEHGLIEGVNVLYAPDFTDLLAEIGTFDFILLNGVIEHIPLSRMEMRKKILLTLFNILNVGGYLYINGTPNRLWPVDFHTTRLWWIPWSRPGSKWAYLKAIQKGRHMDNPDTHSAGPLGLEERGAWGATFFEIKKYLAGEPLQIINLIPNHNKHLTYTHSTGKRRLFDFIVYLLLSKWMRVPITALAPSINHLVIQRCA